MKKLLINERQLGIITEVWNDEEFSQKKSEYEERFSRQKQTNIKHIESSLQHILNEYDYLSIKNVFDYNSQLSYYFKDFDFEKIVENFQNNIIFYSQAIKKLKNVFKFQKDVGIDDDSLDQDVLQNAKNLFQNLQNESNVLTRCINVFKELNSIISN